MFSLGYSKGIWFKSKAGTGNGQFTGINFDSVGIGVVVEDTGAPAVIFSNLNIANDGKGPGIAIQGSSGLGMLHVRGGSFWGPLQQAVVWNNAGLIAISDTQFNSWSNSKPCIELLTGRAMIRGNYFQDAIGTAIEIHDGPNRVLVTGNMLIGNAIKNNGKNTMIANNQN